jgi:hypothetical protein
MGGSWVAPDFSEKTQVQPAGNEIVPRSEVDQEPEHGAWNCRIGACELRRPEGPRFAQMDIGGFLWLIIDVTFVLVLGAALILGIHQWRQRRRSRVTKEAEERAVDRAYED